MNFFKRLFNIGKSEAHAIADKMENPIKMINHGIKDLKKDLESCLESYAQVKGIVLRTEKEMVTSEKDALEWDKKARNLLVQAQAGKIDQKQADRLASEALSRKKHSEKEFHEAKKAYENQKTNADQLVENINKLKSKIQGYESELLTLKARSKTADATAKINKQMAGIDSNNTIGMIECMRDKIEEVETLSITYAEIGNLSQSLENEISETLDKGNETDKNADLLTLKKQLAITE